MKLKAKISNHPWTIFIVTEKEMEAFWGEGLSAWTDNPTSEMYIVDEDYSKRLLIHEIFHAYCKYFYLQSTRKVTKEDMEEMIAEMLEDKIYDLIRDVDRIHRQISRKLKGRV